MSSDPLFARAWFVLAESGSWLEEIKKGRLETSVVRVRAVCQFLRDPLKRDRDPDRRRDVEKYVSVHIARGMEHGQGIDPGLPRRIGVVETRDVARIRLAVVSADEESPRRGQVVLEADQEGLPVDGVKNAVRI